MTKQALCEAAMAMLERSYCPYSHFAVGAALLGAVLLVPALEPLFSATKLSAGLLAAVVGLSAGSMLVIQLLKALRTRK